MNQPETVPPSEPPVEQTAAPSKASTPKPPRNPVERAIVWGVILVGLAFAGYEARAKVGYDRTYSSFTDRLKQVDESPDASAKFTFDEAMSVASLSPSVSGESKMWGLRKTRVLSWPSLAKTYELTLIMDEDNVVLGFETPNPPEEPEPEYSDVENAGDASPDGDMRASGGGGPPASHDAQGGSPAGGVPGEIGAATQGGGRPAGAPRGLLGLLGNDAVAAELQLSEEQNEQIAAFAETIQTESSGMRELMQQMRDAAEDQRGSLLDQLNSMRSEVESKTLAGLSDILDEQQINRLQQIDWQRQGPLALTSKVVMEKLELSSEQQDKLTDLSQKQNVERRELGREASREDRQALNDKYNAEFAAVLTEEQTAAWNGLLGEKFDIPSE